MIAREGRSIHFGDFHGQWNAAEDELALLVAGLWRHGYDFTAFQSPDRQEALRATVERNRIPLRIFPGREYMYDWGHLTTVGTTGDAPPINDPDVESVLRWFKANSEWVVLAHPYAFMIDRLESLLDAGLLDAVELVNGDLGDRPQNFPKFTRCPRRIRLADNRSPASWGRRKAGGCGRRPGQGPRWRGRSPRRAWRGSRLAGCASRE